MSNILKKYDAFVIALHEIQQDAEVVSRKADALESFLHSMLGISYVDRDPGFPGYRIDGVDGYHQTPRDAIAAKVRKIREDPLFDMAMLVSEASK